MLQRVQDTNPNLIGLILQRIIPIIAFVFVIYMVVIGIAVYSNASDNLANKHEQANTILQAQLITELNFLLRENQEVANTGRLRSQAEQLLANDQAINAQVNELFADLIRLNPNEYLNVQYIASNGVILNEVINERGLPRIVGEDILPRTDVSVIQSNAFQSALQAVDVEDFYISDYTLVVDKLGEPVNPLQPIFSVYVPVFDLQNKRTPLGTVRFVISADSILEIFNNPILSEQTSSAGQSLFLLDAQDHIIANSNASSQDYLYHLVGIDEATEIESRGQDFHDIIAEVAQGISARETTLLADGGVLYTVREFQTGDSQNTAWRLVITDSQSTLFTSFIITVFGLIVATLVVVIVMLYFINQRIIPVLQPYIDISKDAQQIASGRSGATRNVNVAPVSSAGTLPISSALSSLSERIQDLTGELSDQENRHNRDMQIVTNIGRETATLYEIDTLIQRSIELICNELGFYHAQVFLVDDAQVNAVLVQSRGDAGQQLLAQGHKLAIRSDSIIGAVTSKGLPIIVNDTTATTSLHGFNPFLPDTRAEMALPLSIGEEIIGALDIQSTEPNVFHDEDLSTFQLITDQLAVAIYNAQLRNQTDQRIEQINRLNRQLTRQAWTETEASLGLDVSYTYNLMDIDKTEQPTPSDEAIGAPITIRGEVIGTLNASPPDGLAFSDGDQSILRGVAERVALAIENARLFQETQVILSETEILYELSGKLSESVSYDDITHAIIQTIAPDAKGGQVWLFDDYIIGDKPTWAQLSTTPTIQYTDDPSSEAIRLDIVKHQLFQNLNGVEVVTAEDITSIPDLTSHSRQLIEEMGAVSIAFIPLNMRGQWKGFLTIYFDRVKAYSEREQRIYNALIDQAGVAIDNRLLLEQTELALERNEKLYASSRIINTAQSLQDLIYAAVATTTSTQVDFWLGIFDDVRDANPWQGQLRIVARSEMGNVTEADDLRFVNITDQSPMRRREPEILSDSKDHEWMWETPHAFVAAFPLFSDNQPTALFFIVSYEDYRLSNEDYDVYRALTGQMSTQIQNSRLLEQTELALAETQRLYIASRAIAGATDIDSILESAAGHLALPFMQSTADQRILISLLAAHPNSTRDASHMNYRYQWTSDADVPLEIPTRSIVPREEAPFAQLFDSRTTTLHYQNIARDLKDNPTIQKLLSQDSGQSAVLAILQTRQNWYGVLICKSSQPNAFDSRFVEFVQAVANQIAIGIENQQLFNAAQAEQERLQTILSTLPTGVIVLDPQTLIPILVNDNITSLLGREVNMGEPFSAEMYNIYRTGTESYYPDSDLPILTSIQSGMNQMADDLAYIDENYQIDLLLSAAPIFDANGNSTAIVAAFQDISNLRSLEQTLQENLRETVSSYEMQRSLTQAESLDELLDVILSQMMLLESHNALILMADEQIGEVTIARQMVNVLNDIRGLSPILSSTDLINIKDIKTYPQSTPEIAFIFEKLDASSALILALQVPSREEVLGWLITTHAEPNYFTIEEERQLTSLRDMARTAIDNRYLVQSTQVALQEARTLYAATTVITASSDIDELGQAIQQSILALEPDMYAAFINLSADETIEMFNVGFEDTIANGMDMDRLRTVQLPQNDGVYVSDMIRSTPGVLEQELLKSHGISAFAAVNLRAKDMKSGRILIGFKQARQLTEGDTRFLNSIADSASVIIDNQALLEQIQATLQETSVLYQSSRALTDASSTTEIIDVVINYLIGPHVNQVFIALLNSPAWDSTSATVEIEAGWQAEGGVNLEGVTLSAEQFPAWEQLSSPNVLMINDIHDEALNLDIMQRTSIESLDTRSLVIIPLRVANRNIGSIWIGSREAYNYTDADARIFQAYAESASLSLEASYLFTQTEHRAGQLETSAEVGQTIGQILDLNELLPQVVDLIRDRFLYDHVQVFLMDNRNRYAVLQASTGEAGRQLLANDHKLARGSQSVIGQVTETGEPSIALDTADANVVHQPNQFLPLTRSEMALPLIVKGKVVGALDVQSNNPNAFSEEDIRALTTLSGQIAIAIDNANLYEEIERRASDVSLLFDITVIATASNTLGEALQTVTDKLYDALNASAAVFYLPQKYVNHTVLQAIALSGSDQPISELSEVTVGDSENLIGLVGGTLNPQLVGNISNEVRYLSITPSSATVMIVPIGVGGRLIGLVVVEHENENAFSQDDFQLVITLAGSLSAVVENSLLVDELQETNDQLREIDRLKGQFLANMSHELRTPLNSIIGFSRVMLKGIDGALTEMQEQDLTTIYNSGQHLLNLINDILDQAKIESGKMDLKFAFFGVKTLIESVKSIGVGLVKEKPIDLFIDLESGLPQAYGDEFRTRQILLNIVSNSAKFTVEGSITIRAYTVQEDETGKTFIRIDVIDTGIGIDNQDIHLLFETFRQVDSSLTRTVGGTGLGLPLSKSLAEMQGGELLVESVVGAGSTFSVTIPIEETEINTPDDMYDEGGSGSDDDTSSDTKSMKAQRPKQNTKSDSKAEESTNNTTVSIDKRLVTQTMKQTTKREVLLIEDNKDMVDQYRKLLQREGFEVQTADHPAYAEAMVSNLRPTVLIMDVNFADGEGWNMLERLKQRDDTFDIPIIVCSVDPDSERAYQIGAHNYISRPFTNEEIVEAALDAEKESQRERILIIDDQPESVRLLFELLNEKGNYRIFSADNGTEGISLVARRQPNLIILDLRMPGMDGFAVLHELRSNPETAEIPVMIVTGEVDLSSDEQELLANVHILRKTDISEEEYEEFIDNIRRHLDGDHGSI
jgi:GAF domain-containing protein/DNA-binding response OmpR family regulator